MLEEEVDRKKRLEEEVVRRNAELVEAKTRRSMIVMGVVGMGDGNKWKEVPTEILEAIHGNWKEMRGELDRAQEMIRDKAKRLEIEGTRRYNEDCECCMERMKEKTALEGEYLECVKKSRDLQVVMSERFGGMVVEDEADYQEACGELQRRWEAKMGEIERDLSKMKKALGRAEEQIESMKEEVDEYTRLEGQREGQEKAKKLREERERVSKEYAQVQKKLGEAKNILVNVERAFEMVKIVLVEMESKAGMVEEWTREKKRLKGVVDGLEEWEAWEAGKKELEDALRAVGVRRELEECDGVIERSKQRGELVEKRRGMKEALGVVRDYAEGKEVGRELMEIKAKTMELAAKIAMMESVVEKGERVRKEVEEMMGVWEKWRAIGETLRAILEVFGRFKDWVLEERIVPVMVRGVNDLLAVMCVNHRTICIESTFGGATPQWFMIDGVNRVPLEKASGFQRFAVSLAMRIVLGRLGVAGIRNRQLFIDEGFTACDGDNLGIVPEMLEELLDRYDTLVIVSHLEKLQEGIRSKIEIVREGDVSWIGYGQRIEELETKKKVGRPSTKKM